MKYIFILLLSMPAVTLGKPLPVEYFASDPKFIDMKISPSGTDVAFTYKDKDEYKVGIMNLKTKKGTYSFGMGPGRQATQFWWVNNERLVIRSERITSFLDGRYNYPELFSVNKDGTKREQLWDFERSFLNVVSILEKDSEHILVSKGHFADNFSAKLYKQNVYTAKMDYIGDAPTLSGGREARILAYEVDTNDNARFAFEYDTVDRKIRSDNKYYMHVRDYGGEWNAVDLEVSEKARPILNPLGFSNDNSKFYFSSNHDSPDSGIMGLFELYFADMELTLIKRHEDVDFERDSYIQSNLVKGVNGELIGVIYEAGYPVVHYIEGNGNDPEINLHKQLRSLFKGNEVLFSNSTLNKEKTLFKTYSDQNPGEFYLFDRTKNKVEYIASSRPKIKAAQMAKVEPFVMNARDDLKMYGQLTLPPGKEIKNLPMVVYPHGGPYGLKDVWRWDNTAQLLANNGYLVLQLNFRGSGGYGSKFEVEGYHEWGAKMQDDLTDATLWAIQQGYADADRICIHGSSYGGYASMQGIVKEPDLYKCAIADAGIYDNELQWKKADSFKANKKGREEYFRQMFGTHENKQLIDSRSPAYNTSGIKAAILLTHGTKDVRVPFENAEVLEKSLKENGIKYDTYFKKDGHGFSKEENRISFYKKMLEFLDKHIGK